VLSPVRFVCVLMACWWHCPRQELDVSSAIILSEHSSTPMTLTSAARVMLAICDKNANDYCISFIARKSKCLVAVYYSVLYVLHLAPLGIIIFISEMVLDGVKVAMKHKKKVDVTLLKSGNYTQRLLTELSA